MIRLLPEASVQLIAAGEIFVKVSSIVKELLDNSLDANATAVRVQIKSGGFAKIVVSDNGSGIPRSYAELLCCRYATSKIETADDLVSLKSFGFRGEALACLSKTADVVVQSQVEDGDGFEAVYHDGVMTKIKSFDRGSKGTTINASNIYRAHPQRRKLSDASSERLGVMSLMSDLIIHFSDVSFSLMDTTKASPEILLSSSAAENRSLLFRLDQISKLLGQTVARELVPIEHTTVVWTLEALLSNAHSNKPSPARFITFVNDRLIQWPQLKRSIKSIYEELCGKDNSIFAYLSISLPTNLIDHNVDPTKTRLSLQDESAIINQISTHIKSVLESFRENDETRLSIRPMLPPRQAKVQESSKEFEFDIRECLVSGDVPINVWKSMDLIGGATSSHLILAQDENILVLDTSALQKALFRKSLELKDGFVSEFSIIDGLPLQSVDIVIEHDYKHFGVCLKSGILHSVLQAGYLTPELDTWIKWLRDARGVEGKDLVEFLLMHNEIAYKSASILTRVGATKEMWNRLLVWMESNAYIVCPMETGETASAERQTHKTPCLPSDAIESCGAVVDDVPVLRYIILAHLKTLLKEFERC